MSYGVIAAGDQNYPITEVVLRRGKIEFISRGKGPSPALDSERITIIGADGEEVLTGGTINVGSVRKGEPLQVTVTFTITEVYNQDDWWWVG